MHRIRLFSIALVFLFVACTTTKHATSDQQNDPAAYGTSHSNSSTAATTVRDSSKATENSQSTTSAYKPPVNTSGDVHVKGYYRKDGTYVRPHTRSKPSKRKWDGLQVLVLVLGIGLFFQSCGTTDVTSDPQRIGNERRKVFHTKECRFVTEIIDKVNFANREEAIAAGFSPDGSNSGCKP